MAKKQGQLTDTGASSGPKPMSAAQHDHFKGLVTSTLDDAAELGHGHAVGSQGKRGHVMVPSDAHKQAGAYLPQAALNVATKDGGVGFDDNQQAADDYGRLVPTSRLGEESARAESIPALKSSGGFPMHSDDIITFDNPAAIREMKQRHAALGRRTLAVVSAALAEWEARIANGEALNMSPADIEALREIGEKMAHEADDLPDADSIKAPKPN